MFSYNHSLEQLCLFKLVYQVSEVAHGFLVLFIVEYNTSEVWDPYRFRQFHLDVSDLPATQTTTAERIRCYTDNTTAPNVPPNIINIPCIHKTRYIIVETMYDAPEDDPSTGPILEICEIEVYGMY